jgi:hypothetical protein
VLKTVFGSGTGADGYGPFDDYDIGSRNQKGLVPTRYGTHEQLPRCVAILRSRVIFSSILDRECDRAPLKSAGGSSGDAAFFVALELRMKCDFRMGSLDATPKQARSSGYQA